MNRIKEDKRLWIAAAIFMLISIIFAILFYPCEPNTLAVNTPFHYGRPS